ncbi:MAG: glycosyltransferase [Acetomicrobium sp.]
MGYMDRRLDVEWIKFMTGQKDIDFYPLGPNTLESKTIAELEKSGVQILQPLIGSELEKFLQSCDVLTMPYVLNKVTIAATAQNKLFQYIAAGRPIVSSAMPHLFEFPPHVLRKARNKEDFVRKIYEAVEMDSEEHAKERLRIASENTWEKRGKELINLIERGIRVREQDFQR